MFKLNPALAAWQGATTPVRSFSPILRIAIALALLVALLALSIALLHAPGMHSGGLMSAAAHHALADGPNTWCSGAPLPC